MPDISLADLLGPLKPLAVQAARQVRNVPLRLRAAAQRHGLVLMYHRIAEPGPDPWDMAVSPVHFAEHLEVLKDYGTCLPLAHLAERMASEDRPRRMVSITFDDGYRDNALAAAPALDAQDLPATIFVVSGTVGAGRDFWWDALARVFLTLPRLPEQLRLEVDLVELVWNLGSAAACAPAELRGFLHWSVARDAPRHRRQEIFLAVWKVLNARPLPAAEALCEKVMDWAGADRDGPASDQTMTADEVGRLASGGLIEIGGHTVTHLPLDTADPATAALEIAACRAQLREMAGRDILSFSYPFGRVGPQTPDLVRDAGFTCACNSRSLLSFPETDRFRIPRIKIPDLDGDQFAALLQEMAGR